MSMELLINKNESEGDIQLSIMDNYGHSFCMLNYCEKEKHSMFFSNFCVNKDNRNKGIGYFFMKQVVDYAKSLGELRKKPHKSSVCGMNCVFFRILFVYF